MIRIKRTRTPAKLKTAKPQEKKYNAREVVLALHKMQYGKCCYCERKISNEGHEKAVEHFHPQSIFVNSVNDWRNLLLACAQCNGKKSDQFPVALTTNANVPKVLYVRPSIKKRLLLDPSDPKDDDPEKHLSFIVDDKAVECGLVIPRDNSTRGKNTIDVTGIHRMSYVLERRQHLRNLLIKYLQLLQAVDEKNVEMAKVWFCAIKQATDSPAEFAGLAREFFKEKKIAERFTQIVCE